MTVLPIVISPDPRLKQRSEAVASITPDIIALVENMFDTMYASNGIGLAAVQVGVLTRVIVVDTEWHPRERHEHTIAIRGNPIALINPEIIHSSEDERSHDEGCLSFPGHYSEVIRPDSITVRYQNLQGEECTLEATGLLSTCLQHEIDHMNGIVFVDHISRLKREFIMRKLIKAQKNATTFDS
ncbi:MAG: peptide deformylase [Alphaproteobacteria bacterium]|jgi:peptide deformylase|nr:MAG: peptide deformylase [Alphaproteobacteria bacterium]